jgi:hypothetical protein
MKLRNNIALMASLAVAMSMPLKDFAKENGGKLIHNKGCRHSRSGITNDSVAKVRKNRRRRELRKETQRRMRHL